MKEKNQKVEVAEKFLVVHGDYDRRYFETYAEADESARTATFAKGKDVLVYQGVAVARPNTKDVTVDKLT